MRDCMVDIETTGLSPDRSAMIQIAAVKFDLQTKEVDTNFFYRALAIPPWRHWEEGTWNWWVKDKADVLRGIISRMEDPKTVMTEFGEWLDYSSPRFWSKPLSFDFPFVASYCRDYGVTMPFNYKRSMDMRSFMQGQVFPLTAEDPQLPFEGTVHDALHDALHQIKMLFHFMENKDGVIDG